MSREIRVYVEGGGSSKGQWGPFRDGLKRFLDRALGASPIRVIPCGSGSEAFKDFETALQTYPGAFNVLLIDSEAEVEEAQAPWRHLQVHQRWEPPACDDERCHFMAQAMEAWMIADPDALAGYYGKNFQPSALPRTKDVEAVPRRDLVPALERAARATTKGSYHKTRDAPKILALLDPAMVKGRASYCRRLLETLEAKLRA